jgi:cell division protein FtsI/penicillin-binding protein 2
MFSRLKIFWHPDRRDGDSAQRAAHLQLANGDYWRKQASDTLHRQTLVEPIRGKIVDFRNRTLAEDVACIDAAVDYRAIDLDEKWLNDQALARLNARMGVNYRRADKETRKTLLEEEVKVSGRHRQHVADVARFRQAAGD